MPRCGLRPLAVEIRPILPAAVAAAWLLIAALSGTAKAVPAEGSRLEPGRGVVLADFESGQVNLQSFEDQDLQPSDWSLSTSTTYDGSQYALKLSGNTWKTQAIPAHTVNEGTVIQVAAFVASIGEMQAFGVSDGAHTLFYTFAGSQLPTEERWEVVYQGAFTPEQWNLYLLPVGRDWRMRYGYDPEINTLVYCNDRDLGNDGVVYFDAIADVTTDLPQAPQVQIVRGRESTQKISDRLFRVGIQFHSQVSDPDSPPEQLAYTWDFGDGATSSSTDPYHDFLIETDHSYTVTLMVRDASGMRGRDSTRVAVDPGPSDLPATMNFVGDVMLARGYDSPGGLIDQHGPEWMFIPTRPFLGDAAELSVCNLECPLTDEGSPHPTKSIVFRGRPSNVSGLTYAGIDLVTLANNHITDYGQRGMEETQEVLDAVALPWFGADDDDYGAMQPYFRGVHGVSLAFVGQCNRTGREYNYQPFLDAGFNKPGFAWEIEANLDRALAGTLPWADLTVMLLHSGIEYSTGPGSLAGESGRALGRGLAGAHDGVPGSPREDTVPAAWAGEPWDRSGQAEPGPSRAARAARGTPGNESGFFPADDPPPPPPFEGEEIDPADPSFQFPTRPTLSDRQLRWHAIDQGADLLICHHPHVLQGFEVYNGVLIAHSLGNFVFDQSYAETFPSVIVDSRFNQDAFLSFTFRPVFLDDMVPHMANGRLGREILDRQAEYSRELGATVTVDPESMQGTIRLHPELLEWTPAVFTATEPLTEEEGWWVTPPVERPGPGTLRRILSADFPGVVEVRVGRELFWHGDFEDEGATFWDLNSTSEVYDETVAHQGSRSLRLKRTPANTGTVNTYFQGYPAALGGRDYSVMAWIKTQNAVNAGLGAMLFTGRGSGQIGTFEATGSIDGTQDWTRYWRNFSTDASAWFLNCRAHMDRSDSGDSYAWFDEARLVAWEPWQPALFPLDVPYPGNQRYIQFRTGGAAATLAVSWEDGTAVDESAGIEPQPAGSDSPVSMLLSPPRPNPFRASTTIEYRLPRGGRVRLTVHDVSGRRVALLADGFQAAGLHRAQWSGSESPAGLYFCRLESGGSVRTEKLVRMR